jgi:hypothetical protein
MKKKRFEKHKMEDFVFGNIIHLFGDATYLWSSTVSPELRHQVLVSYPESVKLRRVPHIHLVLLLPS